MGQVVVWGASDDCIEIEGDVREEFYAAAKDAWFDGLVFSTGTVVEVEYDHNGVWRVGSVRPGGATITREYAPKDDEDNYSDRLTIVSDEPIEWVLHCLLQREDAS